MSITDGKAVAGRSTAITVLTPIKVGATPLLRAVFWIGGHVKMLNKALEELSFIHYARWSIITGLPDNGPAQPKDVLNHDYLFFQTNFNGTWDEYIDAFSEVVPHRMTAIWGTSYGFPGPGRSAPSRTAHAQLTAPIILVRDNLNMHRSAAMGASCDAHSDWLTMVQLPAYAPELNATEGMWAHVQRDLSNLLAGTVDELAATAKRLLKRIQYRPELIDGFRAQTGLALDPQTPVARP